MKNLYKLKKHYKDKHLIYITIAELYVAHHSNPNLSTSRVVRRSSESLHSTCMRGRKGLILNVASCFNGAASHLIWPYLTFRGRDTLPHQNKLPLTSQGRGSSRPWGCSGHRLWAAWELQYIIQEYMSALLRKSMHCVYFSLDNTNAYQDQHSIFSCSFSFLPQGDFWTFWRFYCVVSCRKTFRGKTQEELMSVKVQKKSFFLHKNMSFTGKHPCGMMELLRASSISKATATPVVSIFRHIILLSLYYSLLYFFPAWVTLPKQV